MTKNAKQFATDFANAQKIGLTAEDAFKYADMKQKTPADEMARALGLHLSKEAQAILDAFRGDTYKAITVTDPTTGDKAVPGSIVLKRLATALDNGDLVDGVAATLRAIAEGSEHAMAISHERLVQTLTSAESIFEETLSVITELRAELELAA